MKSLKQNRKSRKIYLILLFFFACLISFLILQVKKNYTVILGDSGFIPREITVPKGATVTWKIEGNNSHWPASDPHPIHTGYPEGGGCIGSKLDACEPLKPGESFSFTFDKVGSWGMHDHLFPGSTMSVIVGESNGGTQEAEKDVSAQTFKSLNYIEQKQFLINLAKNDPKSAWELLKKTYMVNGQVVGNAHQLAHIVGNAAYDKYGFDGIKICDTSFSFGCYHGVTERMLIVEGKDSIKHIETTCVHNLSSQAEGFTGCIHGIGHGLVGWTGLDLGKALNDCNLLTESNRTYCYNGALMEYTQSAPADAFNKDNPWSFCANMDAKYQSLCGNYQIIVLSDRLHFDSKHIEQTCSQAPNRVLKEACFRGVGSSIAQQAKGNIDQITKNCSMITDNYGKSMCVIYAADQVVFQEYEDWKNVSSQLCDGLSLDERQACFSQREQTIRMYDRIAKN